MNGVTFKKVIELGKLWKKFDFKTLHRFAFKVEVFYQVEF